MMLIAGKLKIAKQTFMYPYYMMIMKKIFTFLLTAACISSGLSVSAQQIDTVKTNKWFKKDFAGSALIGVTYRKTELTHLNQILNANGIPSVSSNNVWINATMDHVFKKFLWEDGIGFTPITQSEVNGLKTKYNQYNIFLRFGYDVSSSSNYRLFPFAGANFNAGVLNIQDKRRIESTNDFAAEILNSTSSKTFYQPNIGIDLGAGFDYLIKLKSKQMDNVLVERNIPIGIRAGYMINAYQGDWKVDNHDLQNGNDKKNSAFFISFNIGIGYHITKTK